MVWAMRSPHDFCCARQLTVATQRITKINFLLVILFMELCVEGKDTRAFLKARDTLSLTQNQLTLKFTILRKLYPTRIIGFKVQENSCYYDTILMRICSFSNSHAIDVNAQSIAF